MVLWLGFSRFWTINKTHFGFLCVRACDAHNAQVYCTIAIRNQFHFHRTFLSVSLSSEVQQYGSESIYCSFIVTLLINNVIFCTWSVKWLNLCVWVCRCVFVSRVISEYPLQIRVQLLHTPKQFSWYMPNWSAKWSVSVWGISDYTYLCVNAMELLSAK